MPGFFFPGKVHGYNMLGADYPSGNRRGDFVFITMSLCLLKL